MLILICFLVFTGTILVVFFVIPMIVQRLHEFNQRRAKEFGRDKDRVMAAADVATVQRLYIILPFLLASAGFILMPDNAMRLAAMGAGIALGVVIPSMYTKMLLRKRKKQFDLQLVDALMIMSSAFRGGLSLVQSMESVVEEMPDPLRHEFGIVLGENKMGVALDEALNRLFKRMPSTALQQMISAILLSRETGGNLPVILMRIVGVIRERRKIEENILVLTMQGKLQALVMSGLPVGFFFMVQAGNPNYFKVMQDTELGRTLLWTAGGLWVFGALMIIKISKFDDI